VKSKHSSSNKSLSFIPIMKQYICEIHISCHPFTPLFPFYDIFNFEWASLEKHSKSTKYQYFSTITVVLGLHGNSLTPSKIDNFLSEPLH
jgi:hypothetical protein